MIATLFVPFVLSSLVQAPHINEDAPKPVAVFGSDNFQHQGRLEHIAYSPQGDSIAAVSVDGVLNLWDSSTGDLLSSFAHPSGDPLFSVDFLDAETLLLGTGRDHLAALHIGAAFGLSRIELDSLGLADLSDTGGGFSVSPNGKHIAQWNLLGNTGLQVGEVRSDRAKGQRALVSAGVFRVVQVAWSEDSELLAVLLTNPMKALGRDDTADQDSSRLLILESETGGKLTEIVSHDEFIFDLGLALIGARESGEVPSGLLVTGGQLETKIWDIESGRALSSFATELGAISSLDLRDESSTTSDLVLGASSGHTQFWRIYMDKAPELGSVLPSDSSLGRITLSPTAEALTFASIEGRTIRQWGISKGSDLWIQTPELARHDGIVSSLSTAPGRIASAGYDGLVFVWESAIGDDGAIEVSSRIRLKASDDAQSLITDVSFSSDGNRLASCAKDGLVRLWNLAEGDDFGKEIARWNSDSNGSFTATDFSPDSSTLASVSANGALWIRDAQSGDLLRKFEGLKGLDFSGNFSADGRFYAVGSSGVRIYDAKTWEQVLVIGDLGSPVMDLALSPDGAQIAIATAGRLVLVKDVATGQLVRAWTNFQGRPSVVCWASSEILLAAAARDGGFRVMSVTGDHEGGISTAVESDFLVPTPGDGDITALAVQSGLVVAAGLGGFIHIWDVIR